MATKTNKKRKLPLGFKLIIFLLIILLVVKLVPYVARQKIYPLEYSQYVSEFSEKYGIDKFFYLCYNKNRK